MFANYWENSLCDTPQSALFSVLAFGVATLRAERRIYIIVSNREILNQVTPRGDIPPCLICDLLL